MVQWEISVDMRNNPITAGQLRAARALLRWTADQLAEKAGINVVTIRRAEPTEGPIRMMPANADAIRRTLEAAGIEFIEPNGGGPGVRLKENPG